MVQNYPTLVNKGLHKYLRWILYLVVVLISEQNFAQQSFNYQAVIRDASGNVLTNQTIGVEIILLQGSATGTNVYEETHTVTSNAQGVIALAVGGGTTVDSFMNIDWSTQDYWLQVGIDTTGGTNYTTLGASQLQSVPYANYAINGPDADSTNEIELPTGGTNGQVLVTDGAGNYSWVTDKVDDADADATNEIELPTGGTNGQVLVTDGSGNYSWVTDQVDDGDTDATNEIELPTGGTNGQVLVTDGSGNYSWVNDKVDDGDTDATNEIELPTGGTNGQVLVTDGSGNYSWVNDKVDDGDIDATNEIELPTGGTSGQVLVTDGSGNYSWVTDKVDDGDTDATNEIELPTGGTNGQLLSTDGSGNYSWVSDTKGAFSTTANVTSNAPGTIATDDFVFGSTQLDNDTSTTDDDNRMFFDKEKGAFRVGRAFSDQWDDANVLRYTIAMGNSSMAKGIYSVAIGDRNTANFDTSIVLGDRNTTDAPNSYALGSNLITNSPIQTSLGINNTSYSPSNPNSFTEPTNRLLVVGNGTTSTNRSDALVILRNGNTTLNGQLTIDGDNQGAGRGYTLPVQDGTANQVMTTDGAGNVSWINPPDNSIITDTDNDTKIQVEETTDEDVIRFDVAGTEAASINNTGVLTVNNSASIGNITTGNKNVLLGGTGNALETRGANNSLNVAISEEYANAGSIHAYNNLGQERFAAFIDTSTDVAALFTYGPNSNNIVMGNLSGFSDNGFLGVANDASSPVAGMYVDADGKGVIYGDIKNFRMQHPNDNSKEIWYASLEGPEAGAYARGTGTLKNGQAIVQFPDHYKEVVNPADITVIITPNSTNSKGLAVIDKDATAFEVKELADGNGNYTFDWIAIGVRKGFENFEVVRKKPAQKRSGSRSSKRNSSSISPPALSTGIDAKSSLLLTKRESVTTKSREKEPKTDASLEKEIKALKQENENIKNRLQKLEELLLKK